ncbi:MAG: hypothetical protein MOB07_31095 [Acidobacteria bacterium]|nr:hypothetical protein [Acidobacteriota bacterium]
MANKKFELNVNGATSVITAATARLALQTAGVILADGERATSSKTYHTTEAAGALPVTYRIITEQEVEERAGRSYAEAVAVVPGFMIAPGEYVAPPEPKVFAEVPARSRRNRSRNLFGVITSN